MAGSKEGGKRAAETIKRAYGEDYFAKIGALGGAQSRNGGFGSDKVGKDGLTGRQRAIVAGATGGTLSKRGKASKGGSNEPNEIEE